MELKLVIKTGRSAVVEFDDGGKYYSKEEYTLLINGEEYGKTEKVVTTIYGLKPDKEKLYQFLKDQDCMQEKNMALLNLRQIMNM